MSSQGKAESTVLDTGGRLVREVDRAATSRAEYERQQERPVPVLDLRAGRPKAADGGATALDVAHRLQQARLRRGFRTQQDAARALGIRNSTYAAHENGNRQLRLDMAEFYADRFDVSIAWLCSGHGEIERGAAEAAALTMSVAPPVPVAESTPAVAPTHAAEPRGPAVRDSGPGSAGSLSEVLERFGAVRRPDGALESAGMRQPMPLPAARSTDGFMLEVVAGPAEPMPASVDPGCMVSVSTSSGTEMRLVADGFVRIPTEMVDSTRLLCVKLPPNPLFPDMPGGQRVFVDPDDVSFEADGVFITMAEPSRKLVPVLIRPTANHADELALFRARNKPPAYASEAEVRARIVGRVVLVLKPFGDIEVDALGEACRDERNETAPI